MLDTFAPYCADMAYISPARRRIALFALALGGFAIGVTEFASMGVLPNIAADLLPNLAESPNEQISRAGIIITMYALGVVIGAPVVTAFASRASQTKLALWLLGGFVVMSVASALAPTFELLVAARFLSGIPHATFFGAATLIAGRIMGPGNQGKGIAIALSGLPIANIVGVPLATWLGQAAGWQWAYGLVAVLFAITFVLVGLFVPRYPGNEMGTVRRSLSGFRNIRVWIMIAAASVGFGGFFAIYSYIAEVTTRVTGLSEGMVPWVLATIGTGMTIGNLLGGWLADRNPNRAIVLGFSCFIAALVLYCLVAQFTAGLFISVFLAGMTSSMSSPAMQARFIRIAREQQLMGAAVSHAAFNIGNAVGAWVGGLVIAAGFGYISPGWAGIALAVGGLIFVSSSMGLQRRDRGRSIDTTGIALPQ